MVGAAHLARLRGAAVQPEMSLILQRSELAALQRPIKRIGGRDGGEISPGVNKSRMASSRLGALPTTLETEQVRARLDFDQQSSTVEHLAAPSPPNAAAGTSHEARPRVDGQQTLQGMRPDQQALRALEAEWAQKLRAPLDELADFEHNVSQSVIELRAFLDAT